MLRTRLVSLTAAVVLGAALAPSPGAAQPLPRVAPHEVGMSAARLARIDTVMQTLVDSARTAGIAVLVLRDGRVVKSGTYGWADREARRPIEGSTLFRIASQTKAVTSVAVMMLVEEGRLRLRDPVQRWMPTFENVTIVSDEGVSTAGRAITIHDLLTQTAGISYGNGALIRERYEAAGLGPAAGFGWYLADKDEPVCVTMDRLGTLPFAAQPGESFVYGYATDVLGCVIERVSGMPLDTFFRTRILEPLGMRDTWFFVPESEAHRLAVVYAAGQGGLERAVEGARGQGAYVRGPRRNFSGGAGLVSTIEDYARFLQMLLNGGELNGVRILSPYGVSLMARDHIGATYELAGRGFGLGFDVVLDPGFARVYGAPGSYAWGGAYATSYWVDPTERIVALIMTQTLPSGGLDAADRFRTLVYAALEQVATPAR